MAGVEGGVAVEHGSLCEVCGPGGAGRAQGAGSCADGYEAGLGGSAVHGVCGGDGVPGVGDGCVNDVWEEGETQETRVSPEDQAPSRLYSPQA